MATYSTTELDAINYILGAVGQAPVTTLDQLNPDVAIAYDALQQNNRKIQEEGWTFNWEYEYPFTPDNSGIIAIPSNVLQLDLSNLYENRGIDAVKRDGKLYNKTDHTFIWSGQVKCDVMWLFDYEDVPPIIQNLIQARAALESSQQMVGDSTLFQMLNERVSQAKAAAVEYETSQGDFSFFGNSIGQRYYNSFQPYQVLIR
jgi:hypothetical protein